MTPSAQRLRPAQRTSQNGSGRPDHPRVSSALRAEVRQSGPRAWVLIALAALTLVLGVLAVVAPVRADDPVVTWPKAGSAPASTVLPLSPYRPVRLDATIPCATLRGVNATGGTALGTQPNGRQGLAVSARQGELHVRVSGQEVLAQPLPADNCAYQVSADEHGVRVLLNGTVVADRPGVVPPQVAELSTQAEGRPEAAGLSARIHTDARGQSNPTTLKLALLLAHAAALCALLALAWRWLRGTESMRGLSLPKPSWADATVVLIAIAWVFLGPMQMDDSWYLLMARNGETSGYIGNYVYMFNATENPFSLSQYALEFWGWLGGWSLWWMRLVPTFYGLVTWGLLRVLFATMLGRAANLPMVPWALLVAHLLWFLPYGETLRPEPLIVACAAATLVFAEAARVRRSVGALAIACVFAVLAFTSSPSGLVAGAPLVLALPWLRQWLRAKPWPTRVATVLLGCATVTVLVPAGFADTTFGDVADAAKTHRWYYLAHPWYEEIVHYNTLLDTSGWARRMPVLLTLALLLVVAIASGRGRMGHDPVRRLVLTSGIITAVALGLIALSPTKWVNHFHAVAAAPTVLIASALLRSPLPRRAGSVIRVASLLVVVGAVSLSFAGDNAWHPFTDAGQRFGNHLDIDSVTNNVQPHVGSLFLRSPLLWLGFALLGYVWAKWWYRQGRRVRVNAERTVLVTASLSSVLLMLALFVDAPIAEYPGWTVARSAVQAASGNPCGLANYVEVLLPSQQRLGPATGPVTLTGDFLSPTESPVLGRPWQDRSAYWHDDQPDGTTTGTGTLTTGWYAVPAQGGTNVTVPLAGSLRKQKLEVQFGTGNPAAPVPAQTFDLKPDPRQPANTWQQLSVPLPRNRPTAVRVHVVDQVTGADSWIAAGEPKLTDYRPVTDITRGATVFADQISAALWPCVHQATLHDGITDAPSVQLTADESIPTDVLGNPTYLEWGGAWVQTSRTAVLTKLGSRLRGGGPPRQPWGQVFTVQYTHPLGQFDVHVDEVTRSGLAQPPTLATNAYPNISRNSGIRQGDTGPSKSLFLD